MTIQEQLLSGLDLVCGRLRGNLSSCDVLNDQELDELCELVTKVKSLNLCSPDSPPFETLPDPLWVEELNKVAASLKVRHPKHRSTSIKVIKGKLTTIIRDTPCGERINTLDQIQAMHIRWCHSADWTKDGGAFAKSLEAWLNPKARLWENEPRPVAAKSEYVDRYAMEGGA